MKLLLPCAIAACGGPATPPAPAPIATASASAALADGGLSWDLIARTVRSNFAPFRRCYDDARKKDRMLAGRTMTKLIIEGTGRVSSSIDVETNPSLPKDLSKCVADAFAKLVFPAPERNVTVVYPILFAPPSEITTAEKAVAVVDVMHRSAEAHHKFHRAEATEALLETARTIGACAGRRGPRGEGHVSVIFDPTGHVALARVAPPFAGTDVGACIEAEFAKASVSPFIGGDVRMGWNFTLR